MKPNAIYSKSGKGVQEASGKTSLLKRADRAVLSAIDGRATLAEVAQKVGKSFDAEFEKLISQLDKEGFVREVAAGAAAASSTQSRPAVPTVKQPAARAPAAKAASAAGGDDLDFTSIMPAIKRAPAAAPPPKAAPPTQPDMAAQQRAKEQEAALYKARKEAEARAQAERDRMRQEMEAKARAEAEAKIRAETEKKVREEVSAKVKADAEAKTKAARDAVVMRIAAEAQAKIDAERRVREESERKAKEDAEKARREAEELRQKLDEERKAREAAELKRREEEERRRQEEEERRGREEAERQLREAEERQRREEEDRRLQEKEEAARRAREEEAVRAHQAREMEEARARARQRAREPDEERPRRAEDETRLRQQALPAAARPAEPSKETGGSLDALMADLDSFSQREEEERAAREEVDRKLSEEKKRKAQEEVERRAREQAAQAELERRRAAEQAQRVAEEERRAQEEAERRVREAEEQRRAQAEERQRRAREALAARAQARPAPPTVPPDDIGVTDADLGMDDVRRDEAAVARDTRKAQREREREARQRSREVRERVQAKREEPVKYPKARRPVKWGRPVAILLFSVLVAGIGLLHVIPLPMDDYEAAASRALGRPVNIGTGRLSLFTGVRLNLEDVTVGDSVRIASVHAYPRLGSLFDERKAFGRIELDGVGVPQQAIGAVVAAKLRGEQFSVERILVSNLKLEGPVPLPSLQADALIGPDGAVSSVTLSGPENLNARLTPAANGGLEFDVTASNLIVPFMPELSLASFAMKGSANRQGMNIASWGGAVLDGVLSGSANVRWTGAWHVDGAMTMRGINAAIFAPALLSEGKVEGSGRFSMSGADPAKLYRGARLDGSFAMGKGVLGSFDLARVLHTGGRQYGGRTQFTEMTGQGSYDRGAIALRNISITAGALNAGISADIAPGGALAGRIVADIRTSVQPLRAILVLGGTVAEPQVRN